MTFRRPQSSDTMIDHAEQHGFIYDEVVKLQKDKADASHAHDTTHTHTEYQPKGDYASDTHTHDTTHDHDADYAPVHDHPYVKFNDDTDIKPNPDNRFITLNTRRFQEKDGTPTTREFGLEIDLDEGNTYKNQFSVGTRNGYALKVLGGTGRETWFGGKVSQKGSSLENKDARDYIIRQNLTDATSTLATRTELEKIKSVVEGLQDAVAEIKEALKLPK